MIGFLLQKHAAPAVRGKLASLLPGRRKLPYRQWRRSAIKAKKAQN
jgi:hypothetical protein